MFWEFVVPLTIILIVCYFLVPTFHYGVNTHIITTQNIFRNITTDMVRPVKNNNTPDTRTGNDEQKPDKHRMDKCSASKNEQCAVGTYKQCTNNFMEHGKCDCTDQRSYELCSKNTLEDPLSVDEVFTTENKDYGKYATRVNQWTIGDTTFNEPANLHIQRVNPYVV
jgi:hypothetical protein